MTSLRNRRRAQERLAMKDTESKSLLQGEDKRPAEPAPNATDGYILRPLKQRHILFRLDFWPFMFCYVVLMVLDVCSEALGGSFVLLDILPQVVFPLALLFHVTLFLFCQWDIFWRAAVGYQRLSMGSAKSSWTHCLVEAPHTDKHHAAHDAGIVQIQRQNGIIVCCFQDVIFRCANEETDADITLWDADKVVENSDQEGISFHRLRYPANLPLSFYRKWTGHVSMSNLVEAHRVFGNNITPIRLPPFLEMLQEQLVAPFFLFQVLCVLLWCLDEYWYYAVFTFFALLLFESTVAYNRLKSLERLRSHTMHGHEKMIYVYRPVFPPGTNGWVRINTSEIVPGDIVSCKEASARKGSNKERHLNRVPADILIISGDAVVDESLLTGESVPQLKTSLEDTSIDRTLDLQEHKQSICFGGTNLLVTHAENDIRIPAAPDRGVIGVVLRTGFETAQGSLLRTMAHTQKSVDGIHTRDTYVFILLLLLCAIVSAYMVWEEGWADESRNKFRLTLHIIMIVTSVVPPELPMELSLAVTNSVTDLMKRCQVYCTEIFRIPIAGQVNVCCFDKTGTLTSDEMLVKGVRLVDAEDGNSFTEVKKPDRSLPWGATFIMAACHALALGGNNNNVIGDPLEKAIMGTTGYRLVNNNEMQREVGSEDRPAKIQIVQRFNFTSRLKRMSVLARVDSGGSVWALTKGAPEVIKKLLREGTCPVDFDQVAMYHMSHGTRVLAMAYRRVSLGQEISTLKKLKRESVECDLVFAGFLLLDCPIKGDSKSVIQELLSSGHQVKMITGDSIFTAGEIARQVGMVRKRNGSFPKFFHLKKSEHSDVIHDTSCNSVLGKFRFVSMIPDSIDGSKDVDLSVAASDLDTLKGMVSNGDASLCISGDDLQDLVNALVGRKNPAGVSPEVSRGEDKHALFDPAVQNELKSLVPLVSVFARHAPRQKEAIVAALNLGGFKTLMCGDGTNDMASLRRAHIGISIISAPEVEAKQRSATAKITAVQKKERKKKSITRKKLPNSSLEDSLNQLRQAQEELNSVELGDASIASPFTSRSVSIKCCKDVLQQGRCTLVTMLQIYKILGINCLVNAMVLSNLFLHGVKQGDRQLTVTGLAVAALFLFVTRGKPLDSISPVRPPASVLCRSALASIAMQFSIHFWAIRLASQVSLSFVDPYDPSMIPDGTFNPNTLNTSAFLMNLLATVNTFAANYRGEPFVEPLRENKMLLRSLQACYAVILCCALELFPPLSDLLQLSEYPSVESDEAREWQEDTLTLEADLLLSLANGIVSSFGFPVFICGLMVVDTVLTFAVEKCVRILVA